MRTNHHEQAMNCLGFAITIAPVAVLIGQAAIGAAKARKRKGKR